MSQEHPFRLLTDLVEQGATGELVCVARSAELHVYLQGGRVAWATDSSEPYGFSRWLLEHTTLSRETYLEVLESCRIDRLPLGETLIDWRVVTHEEIRNALRFQIVGALSHLESCEGGRALFLERQAFSSYNASLTFELDDLIIPPPRESTIVQGSGLLDRLAGEIPEATFFELLESNLTISQRPAATASRIDPAIANASILDGAELVAHRSARGTVLGVALSPQRTVWCGLDAGTAFAAALATVCNAAAVDIKTTPPLAFDPSSSAHRPLQRLGDQARVLDAIEAFLALSPEILGVVVADQGVPRTSVHRRPWDPHVLTALVQRRAGLLDAEREAASVVTAERNLWCFGGEVGTGRRHTLWLFLDRGSAQGLGWAYLASLGRQLATLLAEDTAAWTQTA